MSSHRAELLQRSPNDPELSDAAAGWRSAYVHIPFCRRRCPYCDFAVVAHDELEQDADISRYVAALRAEMAMEPDWLALDAVNLGGGTPTTLDAGQLSEILSTLERRFGLNPGAEISIEANPEDITPHAAAELARVGFTRVSLGMQSLDATILGVLGRRHDPSMGLRAVELLRDAGIRSISLDLIFGTAGETLTAWTDVVERAVNAAPDHLSAYSLTVEPGTDLWKQVRAGGPEPDPDLQADKYETVADIAAAAGLVHYEVSNWAQPGHGCRYNLATWAQGEYVAFGLGAHGHREGRRRQNVRRFDTYLERIERGLRPEQSASQHVTEHAREQERIFVGVRRRCGVNAGAIGTALAASPIGQRMQAAGIMELIDGRLIVTKPLMTDMVAREVLSLSPEDC